jgi:hypothetical protein
MVNSSREPFSVGHAVIHLKEKISSSMMSGLVRSFWLTFCALLHEKPKPLLHEANLWKVSLIPLLSLKTQAKSLMRTLMVVLMVVVLVVVVVCMCMRLQLEPHRTSIKRRLNGQVLLGSACSNSERVQRCRHWWRVYWEPNKW